MRVKGQQKGPGRKEHRRVLGSVSAARGLKGGGVGERRGPAQRRARKAEPRAGGSPAAVAGLSLKVWVRPVVGGNPSVHALGTTSNVGRVPFLSR